MDYMDANNMARITDGIRLSVIIPTYNCREYLSECLQSVLRQLPPDCELLIAADGSDDGTADLLASYADKQNHVHTVCLEHNGASAARNAGLHSARGEYVTFVDCDDCMRDGFLRDSLPLLDGRTDLYIFGIERVLLSGIREFWTMQDRIYPEVSAFADEYIRIRQLLMYSNCNKFYRRSVIERLQLRFDENTDFGEDRLFNYRFNNRFLYRLLDRRRVCLLFRHHINGLLDVLCIGRFRIRIDVCRSLSGIGFFSAVFYFDTLDRCTRFLSADDRRRSAFSLHERRA